MPADPILKELWEIKENLSAECDHILRCLFDKLKESQDKFTPFLVDRSKWQTSVAEKAETYYGPSAHTK